jgi:hypothetical protein
MVGGGYEWRPYYAASKEKYEFKVVYEEESQDKEEANDLIIQISTINIKKKKLKKLKKNNNNIIN